MDEVFIDKIAAPNDSPQGNNPLNIPKKNYQKGSGIRIFIFSPNNSFFSYPKRFKAELLTSSIIPLSVIRIIPSNDVSKID
jgi:hypothetical protein